MVTSYKKNDDEIWPVTGIKFHDLRNLSVRDTAIACRQRKRERPSHKTIQTNRTVEGVF